MVDHVIRIPKLGNILLVLFSFAFLNGCDDFFGGGKSAPSGPPCAWGDSQRCPGRTLGECDPGYRSCLEAGGGVTWWSDCRGIVLPQDEVCDGLDNNCDNRIDEGVANACGGCGEVPEDVCDGEDNDCDGEVDEGFSEIEEICNGIDDDCDSLIDEGWSKRFDCQPEWATDWVIYNDLSTCHMGWMECREGGWTECFEWGGPQREICNGLDDDCDGVIDDLIEEEECGLSAEGVCQMGTLQCVDGELICINAIFPENEICDALDNDCDRSIDEDLSRPCETICEAGTEFCFEGEWINCTARVPIEEICNGEDDDCDGLVDEFLECECAEGSIIPCQLDICGYGIQICIDGQWSDCNRDVVINLPEVCNDYDDNCNEEIDENISFPCYEGEEGTEGVGLCQAGEVLCEDGRLTDCRGQVVPEDEICDGLDNDCDGVIDNMERVFEKVDMVFMVDVSASMDPKMEFIINALENYLMTLQGANHRFALVFYGDVNANGDPYVGTPFTDAITIIDALRNASLDGFSEPSIDTLYVCSSPANSLGLGWRADATPILILLGDENPQTNLQLGQPDLQQVTEVCQLIGCNNATNTNWTDGDPLEIFAIVPGYTFPFWNSAIFAPGTRLYNISMVQSTEQLNIFLDLVFSEICVEN
ncbi:MAG TPA: hypothetical protein EYG51_26010 [Pseudomonadales bacterium]|nr:hypothetical protein [Pseudomonadales bacterium]